MGYADPAQKSAYQNQWMARRRAGWFADKSCAQCGSTEDLEVDHVNPSAKVDHRIWSWSKERREAELAKCHVLCRPHHQEKSLARDNPSYTNGFVHGTRSMYQKHRCRCDTCRAWQSARLARQRSSRLRSSSG